MKKILLLALGVLTTVTLMLLFQNQHNKYDKCFVNTSDKGKSDDVAGAAGMVKYFNKIECDPATGKMDLTAYYNALSQVTSLKSVSSRSANSGLGLQWNFIGPDNIGGRTRAILFDRNNPDTVYAGGVSGGLWISADGGQSWVEWSGSNQLQNMNIVSICQDDSGYIYFGTGEGFVGIYSGSYGTLGTVFPGDGVWKGTTPHNASFAHLSSTTPVTSLTSGKVDTLDPSYAPWSETNRLAANPHSPDSIIAATVGGIMVSGNGGKTWTQATGVTGTPQYVMGTDVKYSIDGKKVFASTVSNPGGQGNVPSATMYYSTNGGKSFTKINGVNGFPKADIGNGAFARIEIGVSPQTPDYAYAVLINTSSPNYGSLAYIVQTTNGGARWDTIGKGSGDNGFFNLDGFDPAGPQGPYDLAIAVSPIDSNTVFVGGTTLYRWTPTEGWEEISEYGETEYNNELHADIHALIFDPTNTSRLIIGCDGGIAQSLNPYNANQYGVLFSSLDRNYDVTQFYSMTADSQGRTLGGTQDNSDEYINFLGNTDSSATQTLGGDGGTTQITSNNDFFATVPGDPYVYRSNDRGNAWSTFYDSIILAKAEAIGVQFVLPFNIWEDQDSLHYLDSANLTAKESLCAVGLGEAGAGEVWVTNEALNVGESTPGWFELGGVAGDVTVVKFSPDGQYLYVGTDQGNIYRYTGFDSVFKENGWVYPTVGLKTIYKWNAADSGISVVKSSYTGFSGRMIMSISVDPNNYNNVVVTCGNFGSTYTSWIATSTDATTSFDFTSAQGSGKTILPYGPVYSSCMPLGAPSGTILAGTWCGVWSSQDFGNTWQYDNGTIGIGNEPVFSIKQVPYYGSYALYIGTYGRGLWASYTLTSFPSGINIVKGQTVNNLNVFPNPLSGTGNIQYTLAKEENVIINLYDITGKLVRNIANENMIAGPVNIQFNVSDLVSGTYIIDVIQGQNQATAKLAVLH